MTDNNEKNTGDAPQPGSPRQPVDAAKTRSAAATPRPRTWMETHGRDLKFILIFVTLMGLYYLATTTEILDKRFFPWYLDATARAGGAVLHTIGYDNVRVVGTAMDTTDGSPGTITVDRGCDAIAPTMLFLSAVIASPASFGSKLLAVVAGTSILLTVNLLRIISLFLTAVHWPKIFNFMHLDAWQWAFIALAVLMWGIWASWVARRQRKRLVDVKT